jgi:hypothetical protein
VEEQHQELCQKLRGHYQYYGIRGNYRLLEVVLRHAEDAWRYWLSRRSQKGRSQGTSWSGGGSTFRYLHPRSSTTSEATCRAATVMRQRESTLLVTEEPYE